MRLIAAAALAWMALSTPPQRVLFANLPESDKAAVAQALDEAAAVTQAAVMLVQSWQPGQQPVSEAGQGVGGAVF